MIELNKRHKRISLTGEENTLEKANKIEYNKAVSFTGGVIHGAYV